MAKNYTKQDVLDRWDEVVGKKDRYDLVEIEAHDGTKQTQLLDKQTGSITVAVDGTGQEALNRLYENAGAPRLDAGKSPKEAARDGEKRYTSAGVLATPTQPDALEDVTPDPVEINPSEQTADTPTEKANKAVENAKKGK